jgi:hypothetical protein
MSAVEDLEALERYIARLRVQIEQQTKHVEGLVDYPELAGRASEILASDMENLRQGLIQIEELKTQVVRELAHPKGKPAADKSDVA